MMRYVILFYIGFLIPVWNLNAQAEEERFNESEFVIQDRFVKSKFLVVSGKKDDAIKLLDSIRRDAPTNGTVYFELAKLFSEKKDYNQTESNLKSALKYSPDNFWFWDFAAEYYTQIGRTDDAKSAIRKMLDLQPKNAEVYNQLIDLDIKNNNPEAALMTLDAMEKNIGWSTNLTLKKAEILDKSGRTDEAIVQLNTLVTKFPKEIKYLNLITKVLHSNDRIAESEPYIRKILEIDPNDTDAKFAFILLTKSSLKKEDVLTALHPLISNPDVSIDLKIKELLPYVQKHAENNDTLLGRELTVICDKLVIAHPKEAKAHAIYADILKNSDNTIAAIRQYEKTLSLNKNNFMVWEQLMYCLDAVENYTQLSATANEAIDYFPNQAISYYFAGKAYIFLNDLKKSSSLLEEASLISAGNPAIESRIHTAKALTAFKQNDTKKAESLADIAIELSKDKNADAYEVKGDIAMALKDIKNAEKYWQKAIMLEGNKSRLQSKINNLKSN
nr:tetratricopeptide repeat protein [Saprospiraceae bacterium]